MVHQMKTLKTKFLELLEKDKEFRYTVAGYLGVLEVLKRLDKLCEEQVKLREEQAKINMELTKLREEQIKISQEQKRLSEKFNKLSQEFNQLRMDFNELRKEQIKLRIDFNELRKEQIKLREEQKKLREDFNKMYKTFNQRLNRIERTLEKLTIDIEEEARSIIKYELKKNGINIELTSLTLPELEINIYGAINDMCIIGEATIRGGIKIVNELINKIEILKRKYPNLLRRKIIPVIYAALPLPELIEEAKRRNIWLLKATKTYHKPKIN